MGAETTAVAVRPAFCSPPTRERLEELFLDTLDELSLDRVVPERVSCRGGVLRVGDERVDLTRYRRVLTVAIGKAAYPMVEVIEEIVRPVRLRGVISGPSAPRRAKERFACFEGGRLAAVAAPVRPGTMCVT